MCLEEKKANIINLYKDIIKDHYFLTKSYASTISYLEKLKLSNKDYQDIIASLPIENKHIVYATQTEQIINILQQATKYVSIEYNSEDIEPTIYCDIGDNTSLLINFDTIENKWYLSSIQTDNLDLIKEIYNDTYEKFVEYLKQTL